MSFTPEKFGQDAASSMIISESRSIPALAPGSVCGCTHQRMDRSEEFASTPQLYIRTGTGLLLATSVKYSFNAGR